MPHNIYNLDITRGVTIQESLLMFVDYIITNEQKTELIETFITTHSVYKIVTTFLKTIL